MNINKFTQKSIEAVNGCQKVALEYGNQQVEQAHILMSLISLDDSLILKLLQKMGIDGNAFRKDLEDVLSRYPKVSGSSANMYFSNDANRVLTEAEDHAKAMGDEYVSVEHLFLAMFDRADRDMKALFARYNITKDGFLKVLSDVRGNQKVVSDNPEATYDTLNKYGYDLVERARQHAPATEAPGPGGAAPPQPAAPGLRTAAPAARAAPERDRVPLRPGRRLPAGSRGTAGGWRGH